MNHIIEINNCAIGRKKALVKAVNCNVLAGKLIVLSGVNGIGKSTLLKTICGIIPAISGEIKIFGKLISSFNRKDLSTKIAFAGTERIREDYISVEEMVRFGRYPYDMDRQSDESKLKVQNLLSELGIAHLSTKALDKISDGEWQKANIARVLTQDTPIIILDEPSAFLDYPSRKRLFNDLKKICQNTNKTIILSTHDIEIANQFADIFWHIENGNFSESDVPPEWNIEQSNN